MPYRGVARSRGGGGGGGGAKGAIAKCALSNARAQRQRFICSALT